MTPSRRIASLDVFRGLTVAGMIVVNHPGNWGAVPPLLEHANWNGCTPADLVFPFFIVIMGMAMPFTLDRRRVAGGMLDLHRHVVVRAALLVAVGVLLNAVIAWPHLEVVRIPGVLQRIAITYLATALLVLHLRPSAQMVAAVLLLLGHWTLLVLVPFDGSAAGIVTPHHNLAAWIDRAIFGRHVLAPTGDPEGVLGLMTSLATALGGACAGRWLLTARSTPSVIARLLGWGCVAVVLGTVWSAVWPMNKHLWTGSYAVYATGLALLVFTCCYVVVDVVPGMRGWFRPFEWLGMHALGIYVGSELVGTLLERPLLHQGARLISVKDMMFWRWLVPHVRDGGGRTSSLAFAMCYAALWTLVAGLLHRHDAPAASG